MSPEAKPRARRAWLEFRIRAQSILTLEWQVNRKINKSLYNPNFRGIKLTIKKTLCVLVAAATIGLVGCDQKSANEIQRDLEIKKEITISGKPISVAYTPSTKTEYGTFAAVFEIDGKFLLAYRRETDRIIPYAEAAAVVQSEMNDGDNEPVNLIGHYQGNRFELSSIEANGYKIDF